MTNYQLTLWDNLIKLTSNHEEFYYIDQQLDGVYYRIFGYMLAQYTEFCLPSALECRGVMFRIYKNDIDDDSYVCPLELVSLPFEKFFNLNENPFTMDIPLNEIKTISNKADGSLISSYMHLSKLFLKSKGSVHSDHAKAAMDFLNSPENAKFKNEIEGLDRLGYTVNMEWTSPDFRIVLPYTTNNLTVLGIRNRENGKYISNDMLENFSEIKARWTQTVEFSDPVEFVESIPAMENIEGFVAQLNSGQRIKIKTDWYFIRHKIKNNINCPRTLFEMSVEEATDDTRALFYDDPLVLSKIDEMDNFVKKRYFDTKNTVEEFYANNKELEQKEYAILGQQQMIKFHFVIAMSLYNGYNIDYKDTLKRRWKHKFKHEWETRNA